MASSDLDPVFSRALRLLHSKSKDAEEQLRAMLDDAIKQRYGSERTLTNYLKKKESSAKRESPIKASSSGGRKEDYHKDVDKKNFEKLTEDDIGESSGTKRKSGGDILKSSHSKQVLVGAGALSASDKLVMTAIKTTEPMANKAENLKEDALNQDEAEDDLALDILEDDLTCVICRGMAIGARNQMVECVECHCLYHQECHQPPIADTEINDPRSAWYCAACTKAINKMGAGSSSIVKHVSGMSLTGITSLPQSASIKPTTFTTSTTKSSPSFTTSGKTFGGLSQVPPKPASSSSSSSSSSSKSVASAAGSSKLVMPNINIISAEKKLQIMKKKAAKQQEKRKHSK